MSDLKDEKLIKKSKPT